MNPAKDDGRYRFVTTCVGSTYEDIQDMASRERSIERATFARKIGASAWRDLQAGLGYDRHLPISKDWHVGYYRSVYRGVPCVYLRHSRIEHIYTLDGAQGQSLATRENPGDAGWRDLARRWAASGDPQDEAAYLAAWERAGSPGRDPRRDPVPGDVVTWGPDETGHGSRVEVVENTMDPALYPGRWKYVSTMSQYLNGEPYEVRVFIGRWRKFTKNWRVERRMPTEEAPSIRPKRKGGRKTNPPRGDEQLRAIERSAKAGDRQAQATLHHERYRRGFQFAPDAVIRPRSPRTGQRGLREEYYFSPGFRVLVLSGPTTDPLSTVVTAERSDAKGDWWYEDAYTLASPDVDEDGICDSCLRQGSHREDCGARPPLAEDVQAMLRSLYQAHLDGTGPAPARQDRMNPPGAGDERLRDLERRAAQGDPQAQAAFDAHIARTDENALEAYETLNQIASRHAPGVIGALLRGVVSRQIGTDGEIAAAIWRHPADSKEGAAYLYGGSRMPALTVALGGYGGLGGQVCGEAFGRYAGTQAVFVEERSLHSGETGLVAADYPFPVRRGRLYMPDRTHVVPAPLAVAWAATQPPLSPGRQAGWDTALRESWGGP